MGGQSGVPADNQSIKQSRGAATPTVAIVVASAGRLVFVVAV